jgi:hypothetical protein
MKYSILSLDCCQIIKGFERLSGLTMGENLINVLHKRDYFVKLQGVLELINVSSVRYELLNFPESQK